MRKKIINSLERLACRMFILLIAAMGFISCSEESPALIPEPTEEEPIEEPKEEPGTNEEPTPIGRSRDILLSAEQQKLVDATISTCFELFRIQNEIEKKKRNGEIEDEFAKVFYDTSNPANIISSPLGMMWSLSMLANAADGNSRQQIIESMNFDGYPIEKINSFFNFIGTQLMTLDSSSKLNIANSVWLRHMLRPYVKESFLNIMSDSFNAPYKYIESFSPNYDGALINEWAARESDGFINPFVYIPDAENKFLLANLIYFNAGWTLPFDEEKSAEETFYNEDGTTSKVKMMSTDYRQFKKVSADEYVALRMPYGNEAFAMIVVWPREDIDKALAEITDNPSRITNLAKDIIVVDGHILRIPKFDFKFTSVFNQIVNGLGIEEIFDESMANFDGMLVDDPNGWTEAHASYAIQTCRISIDEKKTEAGAGSYILGHSGENPDPLVITLDRPFLFFISERSTGLPIFMGRIAQF
ncbi:MAG: hypothetical protein K2M06_05320 [Muribaculaceae bacterium]|nr:hypothetical protein [Muribaculaceae bacterium]